MAFIANAFNLKDQRSVSDFDVKHLANFNGVWDIPIGRNRRYGSGMNGFANAIIGGWQLSGIVRYDSGYPMLGFFDSTGWQTNWNIRSYNVQLQRHRDRYANFGSAATSCVTGCSLPNLFANPNEAWSSFRNAASR